MSRKRRAMVVVAVLVSALASTSHHARAADAVSGVAVCDTSGTAPHYLLNWSVTGLAPYELVIESATQSGAFTGPVTMSSLSLDQGDVSRGVGGPVPGTTTGTVTLTVEMYAPSRHEFSTVSGSVSLDGNCRSLGGPAPTSTSSTSPSSSTSSTSGSTTSTTRATATTGSAHATPATATAVAARPTFTG